jgi:predicted esterase
MLLITGEKDHIAPHAIAAASYRKQKRNRAATQIQEIPGRGHSWSSTAAGKTSPKQP